jgi:4-diphosphocytidyl-2-C-methyl-D-erythritol kinase
MTARVRVRSLAKVNLDLRVLNKRLDGFHDLRTIFQTISLADTIGIDCAPGRTRIDLNSNLNIPDNLIVRAADSVLKETRKTARIGFVLKKRIPLGAGLGGGSSNAATVLLALPKLLGKPLPMEKLMELAAELGSDVPFFLLGGAAVGLGRGTELYPLPDLPKLPALLITPGIHVSTPDAYRALGRNTTGDPGPEIREFQALAWKVSTLPDGGGPVPAGNFINDFETVVFRQHPQLKSIKGKLLKLGARPAMMSGSGSTVFGIFPTRDLRDRAARMLGREFAADQIHSVQLVSRSGYSALWRRQLASVGE